MPKRVYFCFKFFTFPVLQTQPVWLNTADGTLKFNQQYYLTTKETPKKQASENFDEVLDTALTHKFTIEEDKKSHFLRYLQEQSLQVEVYDADSQNKYGQGRVSLIKMLR
jgi:hypothetical protein